LPNLDLGDHHIHSHKHHHGGIHTERHGHNQ